MEDVNKTIEWTIHLAQKYPKKAIIVFMILIIMSLSAFFLKLSLTGILSPFILIIISREFLFPIKYILNESGISVRCLFLWSYLLWEDVNTFQEYKDSVFVGNKRSASFSLKQASVLVHLPEEKADIITYIKSHVKEINAN